MIVAKTKQVLGHGKELYFYVKLMLVGLVFNVKIFSAEGVQFTFGAKFVQR